VAACPAKALFQPHTSLSFAWFRPTTVSAGSLSVRTWCHSVFRGAGERMTAARDQPCRREGGRDDLCMPCFSITERCEMTDRSERSALNQAHAIQGCDKPVEGSPAPSASRPFPDTASTNYGSRRNWLMYRL